MPYIAPSQRVALDKVIDQFPDGLDKGEVNYIISRVVWRWVRSLSNVRGYGILSLGHSVLQDATAEYYRRVMAPYEDQKISQNGDVYGEK